MRVLMVTSFPIPGEYDGTAMLPIKIIRALKKRGVEVVLAHLQAREPWRRPARGDLRFRSLDATSAMKKSQSSVADQHDPAGRPPGAAPGLRRVPGGETLARFGGRGRTSRSSVRKR